MPEREERPLAGKKPYEKPELVRFGEIRQDTGAGAYDCAFADCDMGTGSALCTDGCGEDQCIIPLLGQA